eukprot:18729-Heterococcus_DN1.PRE.1
MKELPLQSSAYNLYNIITEPTLPLHAEHSMIIVVYITLLFNSCVMHESTACIPPGASCILLDPSVCMCDTPLYAMFHSDRPQYSQKCKRVRHVTHAHHCTTVCIIAQNDVAFSNEFRATAGATAKRSQQT